MWTKKDAMTKPGCLLNAADDEPVFILRGKDAMMPLAIEAWAELVEKAGGAGRKTMEAKHFAMEVRHWQKHCGCKIPD